MKLRLVSTLFLLLIFRRALASDTVSSSIEGLVTLNAAAALPGVTIGVDSVTRGNHLEATTNVTGHYILQEVRPGTYSVSAEAKGYGCIIYPHVAVNYGQKVRQDFNFVRGKSLGGCEPLDKKK
jgi:hypothetical protein